MDVAFATPDKTITFFCEKDFTIPLYPPGGLQP